jgi:hypothetical protein
VDPVLLFEEANQLVPKVIFKKSVVALGLVLGLASVSGAGAQECSCTTALSTAPQGGVVIPTSGSVTVTTTGGLVRISARTALGVNSQFSTAPVSTASYAIGNCSGNVGPQFNVLIRQVGNNICVVERDASLPQLVEGGNGLTTAAAVLGATGAGAAAIYFGIGQNGLSK